MPYYASHDTGFFPESYMAILYVYKADLQDHN